MGKKIEKIKSRKLSKAVEKLMDPAWWAEYELGMTLYPKQVAALRSFVEPGASSFQSCNGGGKTVKVAVAAILYLQCLYPKGIQNFTSASWRQVQDQLVPALFGFAGKFSRWNWTQQRITTPEGGFIRFYSCSKPGRAEGDHPRGLDAPLTCYVDEAKSAPEWLREAIEGRVRPTTLNLMSSPGFAEGWFWKSQTLAAKDYRVMRQAASECPHISAEEIATVRRKWCNWPDFAGSVLGECFINLVEGAIIHAGDLTNLYLNPPEPLPGDSHAFCDFSWGAREDSDANVLAVRHGNQVRISENFHSDNLHGICDQFVAAFKREGLEDWQISGDEGGGGKLIMDELDNRGWRINRVNNGFPGMDPEHFVNIAAEMWFNLSKLITNRQIILPDNDELRLQLVNRKAEKGAKNKYAAEPKSKMKERGVSSPDLGDAVAGCVFSIGEFGNARPIDKVWTLPEAPMSTGIMHGTGRYSRIG